MNRSEQCLSVALDIETLYREHAQRVAAWACRLGGPGLEAEDLVQEVFLIAQRQLPGFSGNAKVTTWLFRITENVVQDRRRKERRRRWLYALFLADAERTTPTVPTPGQQLEQRQAAAMVYRILDRLGEKYRTPLILFELEGHSGEAIAEMLAISTATVWVRLHRARAQFLRHLEESEREEEQRRAHAQKVPLLAARLPAIQVIPLKTMGKEK